MVSVLSPMESIVQKHRPQAGQQGAGRERDLVSFYQTTSDNSSAARASRPLQERGNRKSQSRCTTDLAAASSPARGSPDPCGKRKKGKSVGNTKTRRSTDPSVGGSAPQAGLLYQTDSPDYSGIPAPTELLARRAQASTASAHDAEPGAASARAPACSSS